MSESLNPVCHTDGQRKLFWKAFDRRRWGFLRWATEVVRNGLQKQINPSLERVQEGIPMVQGIIPKITQKAPMMEALKDIYGRVGGRYGRNVFQGLSAHKQESEEDFSERIQTWFEVEGAQRVKAITDTTREQLREALRKAVEEGMSIEEAAREMQQHAIVSRDRARLIARTEIISASNRGSLMGAERIGAATGKEWLATPDNRTRPHHMEADGQQRPLNEPFRVMGEFLMFPGDPRASPSNSIMCRCTLTYQVS